MVTKKPIKPISDIQLKHVMAFNAVSAPAHIGIACGHRYIDADGVETEVIIIAKDNAALAKFHIDYGLQDEFDKDRTVPVGLAHLRNLRILKASEFSGESGGSIPTNQGVSKPDETDSEDW